MKTPTYYAQIRDIVAPHLQWYKTDLTTLDRAALRGYTGALLHASRASGTDLVRFTVEAMPCAASIEAAEVFALRENNTLFLYGSGGQVRQVTRKEAARLFAQHVARIRQEWKAAEQARAAA